MSPLASLGRHDRFGRLCNLGLSKKLRFSLQRHKTAKSCAFCDSLPVYCFCRLCDRVLPKKQRFSLQRHKSSRIRHSPNSGTVRRFSLWNVFPPLKPAFFFPNSAPLNSGLWLGAFGKVWLFRCQSGIRGLWLLFRCQSGIRGLWLTAFGKSGLFICQSRQ